MGGPKQTTDIVESYRLSTADSLKQYHTIQTGLTTKEAEHRQETFGFNILQAEKKERQVVKFARQFKDLMLVLLTASSVFSFIINDVRTGVILLALVFINAIIGFTQEYKAEKVMASLEKLVVPLAKVMRGGKLYELPSKELVPGDIIYIEEGDSIPADARVLEETELSTNDFALTGESNPSRKFQHAIEAPVIISSRHNLVFMGTTVATGEATCLVVATGMQTELGRIAALSSQSKADPSPLQKEMHYLALTITKGTLMLGVILVAITLKADFLLKDALLFAIGIASAMIPNGLPAEISTALATTASKMVKKRVLVKKLSAVETLGATSVILTDKTGTLTKNEMTVQQVLVGSKVYSVSGTGYAPHGHITEHNGTPLNTHKLQELRTFFACGFFASNAHINAPDQDHPNWYCIGDPTEGALLTLAKKASLQLHELEKNNKELREHPFDSARKRMSSIRLYEGTLTAFAKGAPEQILKVCTHIWDGKSVRKLTVHDIQDIHARNELWASAAMRNLAYAYRQFPAHVNVKDLSLEQTEQKMIFMGLVSMIDPEREEVPEAMRAAYEAHIPVSIITGDNALTARAIAVRSGLGKTPSELTLIDGDNLPSMSDHDVLALVVRGKTIFSRVAPEDKLRIVELTKKAGLVVAVTGDGINDAPALKRADIGVAMGKTGTDVAKQSAEIVLLDDSFHTLIGAIESGRLIYKNIKKAALSVLTANCGELLVVLIGLGLQVAYDIPVAITAIQILCIDLIAELPSIAALGWDPPTGNIMQEKPRKLSHHILNKLSFVDILISGTVMSLLSYGNYLLFMYRNDLPLTAASTSLPLYTSATTLTLVTLSFCIFGGVLLRRIEPGSKLLTGYVWSNKKLWLGFFASRLAVIGLIYTPFLQPYIGTAPLGAIDWLSAICVGLLYMTVRQTINRAHAKV